MFVCCRRAKYERRIRLRKQNTQIGSLALGFLCDEILQRFR